MIEDLNYWIMKFYFFVCLNNIGNKYWNLKKIIEYFSRGYDLGFKLFFLGL